MPLRPLITKKLATKVGKNAITKPIVLYEMWLRLVGRAIQFIFALVVVGLYGTKVHADSDAGTGQSVRWVFAVSVASLSAIIAVLFAIPQPFVRTARLFYVDFTFFVLYIAIFGTFAVTFLKMPDDAEHETYDGAKVSTMRHAVWIDFINAIFWLLTGGYGFFRTFLARKVDETIDNQVDKFGSKVADKMGPDVTAKMGAASDFGSKVSPFVFKLKPLAKVHPKFNKYSEAV